MMKSLTNLLWPIFDPLHLTYSVPEVCDLDVSLINYSMSKTVTWVQRISSNSYSPTLAAIQTIVSTATRDTRFCNILFCESIKGSTQFLIPWRNEKNSFVIWNWKNLNLGIFGRLVNLEKKLLWVGYIISAHPCVGEVQWKQSGWFCWIIRTFGRQRN